MTMSHQRENINNKTEIITKNQTEILELESTIINIKNSLEGIKNRFELAKGRISKPRDRSIETMQFKEHRGKKMKKREQRFREMCHTIKHTKICIREVLAEEERKELKKY